MADYRPPQLKYTVIKRADLRLGKRLGNGSFGEAFSARWNGVDVVVKSPFRPDKLSQADWEHVKQQFLQEAEIMCAIPPHPCVARCLGLCLDDLERPTFVQDFAVHGDLESFLFEKQEWKRPDDVVKLVKAAVEASAGIKHLHAHNIVHRDIAARNFLVFAAGDVRVSDFGLARRSVGSGSRNGTVTFLGPFKWEAPEVWENNDDGKKPFAASSDVYSFGVTLYEIFVRKQPYHELVNPSPVQLLELIGKIRGGYRMDLPARNHHGQEIPAAIRSLIADCWLPRPAARPTMEQVNQRLCRVYDELAFELPPDYVSNGKSLDDAAWEGDINQFIWLCSQQRVDVNAEFPENDRLFGPHTALYSACAAGHLPVVRYAVSVAHADVNKGRTDDGTTPLYNAAQEGHLPVVQWLVSEGKANVNQARTDDGITPLYMAAQEGHLPVVQWLVSEGKANVNQATTDIGSTPLYVASQNGDLPVVKWLVSQGKANVNQGCTDDGATPLWIAAQQGHLPVVQCLVLEGKANVNQARTDIGATPLYVAAQNGHLPVVQWLVSEGKANVNQDLTDNGDTPLYVAAGYGHLPVVQWLVSEGKANVNQGLTTNGSTPLFIAAENGHLPVVQWLVSEGKANVNQGRTDHGATPLWVAAFDGHLPVVQWLLSEGKANVNQARSDDGATPLYVAAQNGHFAVVQWLVSQGRADPKLRRGAGFFKSGHLPIDVARLSGHKEVEAYLSALS